MKSFGNSFLGICLGIAVLVLTFRGCPKKSEPEMRKMLTK